MALDTSLKMGIVDISLMHILRNKKKQSPKKTAKKIIDNCNAIFPPISSTQEDFDHLINFIIEGNFTDIRQWILEHYLSN